MIKYILISVLALSAGTALSQEYSYSKATYYFFGADSATKHFGRDLVSPFKVIIDTGKKKITIPHLEMTEAGCNWRDIIRNVYGSSRDTTLTKQNWNDGLTMITNRIRYVEDGFIKMFDCTDGTTAMQVGDYFIISFPVSNKYIRQVSFEK